MTNFQTIAEKYNRRYVLKHDEKGFFFDGMHCASFRRKTRASIEAYANKVGFDVLDVQSTVTAPAP